MKLPDWTKEAQDMTAALEKDKKLVGQMKERFGKGTSKVSLGILFFTLVKLISAQTANKHRSRRPDYVEHPEAK